MEDNFYQASTERLIPPTQEQQKKFQQAKNAFEKERPLITAVIEHLEDSIAFRKTIDSIEKVDDPEAFMREILVNKQVCSILEHELNAIKTKARMFDKKELK